MQTFLPFESYLESVECLDRQRLGKQRVETLQIMTALLLKKGWVHHPATRMWRGYERSLMWYQVFTCYEWTKRGYKDTCLEKTEKLYFGERGRNELNIQPPWVGDEMFHLSHQSNLFRKDPHHYSLYFPHVDPTMDYVWP